MQSNDVFLDTLVSKLTLEEKIGATLTAMCQGSAYMPYLENVIRKYNIGGFRIVPAGRYHQRFQLTDTDPETDTQYVLQAGTDLIHSYRLDRIRYFYKRLQDMALSRKSGIPLHIAFDQEGEFSGDLRNGGSPVFPPPMGITASGDPTIAYEVALSLARIARSVCANMIHSPVLDVNVNPLNPEINTRSYSDIPEKVAEFAVQAARGFKDGGCIATAKHFPGRGDCATDAHLEIPVIDPDYDTLWNRELLPYRALIDADVLPAIMTAHTVYPALDPDNVATLSPKILKDLLREKMGFKGVITSDAIGMKGITLKYDVPEATAKALESGVDMVLLRMSTAEPITPKIPAIIDAIRDSVESGRLPEAELNGKVRRILAMKQAAGLFDWGNSWREDVNDVLKDKRVENAYMAASTRNVVSLRSEENVLPLQAGQRALVIEQTFDNFLCSNNDDWFPGILYDSLLKYSSNLSYLEITQRFDEEQQNQALEMAKNFDTVIVTNWTRRSAGSTNSLVEKLTDLKANVVLVCNTPYEALSIPRRAKNVVVHFGVTPQSVRTVAGVLFGQEYAQGQWPVKYVPPTD